MEAFGNVTRQKFVVVDLKQILHDEPERLFRSHPVPVIETGQIHWKGKRAQRAFTAQIAVKIEVTHCQLA